MKTIPTLILFLIFQLSFAQSLVLDESFSIAASLNSDFRDFAVLPDGKLLVCGSMMSGYRVLRFNANGSVDSSFTGSSANSFITKIVVDTQGRIYVLGGFTQYNGLNRKYLVRLNSNGSLDTSFNPSFSEDFASGVEDLDFLSDGRIVVVGDFTCPVGPQNPVNFVVLSEAGSLDNSLLYQDNFFSSSGGLDKVFIDSFDNIYVTAFFSGLKKFNSNLVRQSVPYSDVQRSLAIRCGFFRNSNELLIGGLIGNNNVASSYSFIAGINTSDYSRISGFANGAIPYSAAGSYSTVSSVFNSLFESGNYIYGAGTVSSYDGNDTFHIVSLNQQGYLDTNFNVSNLFQFYNNSYAIRKFAPYDSESFIVVGNFSSVNGVASKRLVRVKLNTLSTDFNSKSEPVFANNTLYAEVDIERVELFDVSGRSVFLNSAINSKAVEFNTISKGVYIMNFTLSSSDEIKVKKVLIN